MNNLDKSNFDELIRNRALGRERWEKEEQEKKRVSVTPKYIGEQTEEKPRFANEVINELYLYDTDIPENIIDEIKGIERTSLIKDLNTVLYDSILRYDYYLVEEIEFDEIPLWSVLHALFLLKEIEAEESLGIILDFLSQDGEFLDFWLGDLLSEEIWSVIAACGKNNLPRLLAFMKEPGRYTYAKAEVGVAVAQLVLHNQLDRATAVIWFEEVFTYFLQHPETENIIDSDLNGFLLCNCFDLRAIELLPLVEQMFNAVIITPSIAGNRKEVQHAMNSPIHRLIARETKEIKEMYEKIKLWSKDELDIDDDELFDPYEDIDEDRAKPFIRTGPKIGRNDPCMCGSGKKYKKCCGTNP